MSKLILSLFILFALIVLFVIFYIIYPRPIEYNPDIIHPASLIV